MPAGSLIGKRILVTGASGFLGTRLCRSLCDVGIEVHAISRVLRRDEQNGRRWWQGDLRNPDLASQLLSKISPDFIFHLAAGDTRAKRDLSLVLPIFYGNLGVTVNVLAAAAETGCQRIISAGSLDDPDPGEIPTSPYAAAKVGMHAYASMFHGVFGLPVVVARVFMAYGPGQEAVQKLVPYVTLSLLRGERPKISSGQRLVDWIYIDDVVDGLIAVAQAKGLEGATVDIGSGVLTSVLDVVQTLVRLSGSSLEPLIGAVPDRIMEQLRTAKVKETYSQIGWRARVPLEKGLARTIAWYRKWLQSGVPRAATA